MAGAEKSIKKSSRSQVAAGSVAMDWLPIVFYAVITLAGVSIATAAWFIINK